VIKLKIMLPVVVLLLGMAGAYALIATRPVLVPEKPVISIPLVTVIEAQPQTVRLNVHSQGVVKPRHELDLTAQVAGKVTFLSDDFVAGGTFNKDDSLVRIDSGDYDVAIVQAQAQIAEAKRLLATEQAQAEQARTEWQALGNGKPTALAMREPQLAEARAKLTAAESALLQARIQRSRCDIRAPFTGRFYSKAVALGQVIQSGEKLARLYATAVVEVRLPVTLEQLTYLDISLNEAEQTHIPVTLSATVAGSVQTWQAKIVRTEGVVDESTGVLYLVAEVRNAKQMPLNGLFVEADIQGKELANIVVLPQAAMNAAQQVLVVDKDQRLYSRHPNVLRTEKNRVLIQQGLQAGERVVTSGVEIPIEGMTVQVDTGK
jgi:RND family efflux transporter MFP subunit